MGRFQPASRALRQLLGVCALLAGLTLLAYWPVFQASFVNFDDKIYVTENEHVQAGLTRDSVSWAFTTFHTCNWHPLTWLALELDADLYGGLKPWGFHLTNVLWHTANTLLLFLVLRGMTGCLWPSATVAALFGLHPLHVESVAWVAERKDVLSTFFWLLTLAAYLHYVRKPGICRYLSVVLALLLGLLAKPMLVTLPCVLLLLDYWPLGRWQPGARARHPEASSTPFVPLRLLLVEKLPLMALVAASCVVTFIAQRRAVDMPTLTALPVDMRVWNALLAYVGYLGKMFWPAQLAVFYPHPGANVSVPAALASGVLLVAITGLVFGPGRRRPYLAVGWLWYLGTLVPVIGLVQVGRQAMADRYSYVPLIGVFLMLVWSAFDLTWSKRIERHHLAAGILTLLGACLVLTRLQLRHWQGTQELWEHAAAVTHDNALAHATLGTLYREQRQLNRALREYETVAAIEPWSAQPHINLGTLLREQGRREEALNEYRKAAQLEPGLVVAHFYAGIVLTELGRFKEAVAEYRAAVRLDTENMPLRMNLGDLLRSQGRWGEALAEYLKALEIAPGEAVVRARVAETLAVLFRPCW